MTTAKGCFNQDEAADEFCRGQAFTLMLSVEKGFKRWVEGPNQRGFLQAEHSHPDTEASTKLSPQSAGKRSSGNLDLQKASLNLLRMRFWPFAILQMHAHHMTKSRVIFGNNPKSRNLCFPVSSKAKGRLILCVAHVHGWDEEMFPFSDITCSSSKDCSFKSIAWPRVWWMVVGGMGNRQAWGVLTRRQRRLELTTKWWSGVSWTVTVLKKEDTGSQILTWASMRRKSPISAQSLRSDSEVKATHDWFVMGLNLCYLTCSRNVPALSTEFFGKVQNS